MNISGFLLKFFASNAFILIASLTILTSSGCRKATTECGIKDPIHNISWLSEYIQSNAAAGRKFKVSSVTYQSQNGFLIEINVPSNSADEVTGSFYDCSGNAICTFGGLSGGNCRDFASNETNLHQVYSNL